MRLSWILLFLICSFVVFGASDVCYETDDGLNIAKYSKTYYNDKIQEDECINGITLLEFYCENNEVKNEIFACNDGCKDGACTFVQSGPLTEEISEGNKYFALNLNGTLSDEQILFLTRTIANVTGSSFSEEFNKFNTAKVDGTLKLEFNKLRLDSENFKKIVLAIKNERPSLFRFLYDVGYLDRPLEEILAVEKKNETLSITVSIPTVVNLGTDVTFLGDGQVQIASKYVNYKTLLIDLNEFTRLTLTLPLTKELTKEPTSINLDFNKPGVSKNKEKFSILYSGAVTISLNPSFDVQVLTDLNKVSNYNLMFGLNYSANGITLNNGTLANLVFPSNTTKLQLLDVNFDKLNCSTTLQPGKLVCPFAIQEPVTGAVPVDPLKINILAIIIGIIIMLFIALIVVLILIKNSSF